MSSLSSAPEYQHLLEELEKDKIDIFNEFLNITPSDTDGVVARKSREIIRRYKAIQHVIEKMTKYLK